MDKAKNILYIVLGIITISSMILGGVTGYARLKDSAASTAKVVEKHDTKIETLETAQIEQRMSLDFIKEKVGKAENRSEKMLDILQELRSNRGQ